MLKLPRLPLIPHSSTPVLNPDGTANRDWYNYWRAWETVNRRSLEQEARDFQLKAAALDPRTYTFGDTNGADLVVPDGGPWLATNMYRLRFSGDTNESFARKADARDPIMLPPGTTFDQTPHHATMQYCDPSVVIDPDSPDYDARYVNDPKGLYYERLEKLESLALRQTSGNLPAGHAIAVEVDVNLDWGALTEQWGILRYISTENLSWMLALNAGATTGANLVAEISDSHSTRLNGFPLLMPFRKTDFTKIRLRGGDALGDPTSVVNTTFNAWGVINWSAIDETTW
jgi:hypothetical protein